MTTTATSPAGVESVQMVEPVKLRFPFWRYFELYRRRPFAFLLDSALGLGADRSFSFMGADPCAVFEARRASGDSRRADIRISRRDNGTAKKSFVDPFGELRALLDELRPAGCPDPVVPFQAGALGYFGYEAGRFVETLPKTRRGGLGLPDIQFGFFDSVLAHDHATSTSYLTAVGRGHDERAARRSAERLFVRRRRELDELSGRVRVEPEAPRAARAEDVRTDAYFDRASYARAVETCKRHIHDGDAFEICLTHQLSVPFRGDAWALYRALRTVSPSPFACYLSLPGAQVVSSSPERFLRLGANRVAESRPMKGTRARGATEAEDAALEADLRNSLKDRAENLMIVDLVRNDLGRVCEIGTVHVPELLVVERYATVFQLTSTVRGVLRDGADGLDLVRAAFPGGSMTGAPKIEAMKIINRLEPVERGIYSGAIGYLDYSGALDLSIVIRTAVVRNGRCSFGVGGAVVADSDPRREYDETLDKARALKLALASVGGGAR
jgi:aminodeoxychorismate synthase component I